MIKNFFVLDPVGELLCFEEEINKPNRTIESRIKLIQEYDNNYIDIMEVIQYLHEPYINPLLNGLEIEIRRDIDKKKKRYEVEIKRRQNKSLKQYEVTL
jgi:hypothetical protein